MACPFLSGRVSFQGGMECDEEEGEGRGELGPGGGEHEQAEGRERAADPTMARRRSSVGESLLLANGVNKAAVFSDQISYSGYLKLDKLLDCQELRSQEGKQIVPDEHLFIVIHQTYELWFKQIIFDIDQLRALLHNKIVDETKTLQIVSLLERTAKILKLLVDQILILETMSPLDFVEFRRYLTSASGFQSLQFRLLENKLGVIPRNRVSYNYQHYREVFPEEGSERQRVIQSELEPSLFVLIDRWLSRTPGIYEEEFDEEIDEMVDSNTPKAVIPSEIEEEMPAANDEKGMEGEKGEKEERMSGQGVKEEGTQETNKRRNPSGRTFWNRYLDAVSRYVEDMRLQAEEPNQTKEERRLRWEEYLKYKKSFETITEEDNYNSFVAKGERRLSHNALKGALMIYFYRDMPRFSQPYQILFYLMDIDSLLQKWRYNHLMLVQRMLGSKMGSGGSSGYMYLRSTVSDRYKVFLDLFNLSTWLIPRNYIPKLSPKMVKTLSGTQI